MSSVKAALLVVGGLVEFGGIVLLAAPDLAPWGRRMAAWALPQWRVIEDRLRKAVGRPRKPVVYHDSATVEVSLDARISGFVSHNPDAPLEEKVEFLLRRSTESQQAMNRLMERMDVVENDAARQPGELRAEFERHLADELRAVAEADRLLRISGSLLLAIGLVCVTVAGFM
jgi:hypothetical protein